MVAVMGDSFWAVGEGCSGDSYGKQNNLTGLMVLEPGELQR